MVRDVCWYGLWENAAAVYRLPIFRQDSDCSTEMDRTVASAALLLRRLVLRMVQEGPVRALVQSRRFTVGCRRSVRKETDYR